MATGTSGTTTGDPDLSDLWAGGSYRSEQKRRQASASKGYGGYDSKADYNAAKRSAKQSDDAQRTKYEAAMRSEGIDPKTNQPIAEPGPSAFAPFGSTFHGAVTGGGGGTVAGFFLGALGFFTLRAYLEGGMPAVRAWYAAKFLNKTASEPNPIPTSAVTTTPSTTTQKQPGTSPLAPAHATTTQTSPTVTLT
jgi:hypothetical protein